MSGQKGRRLEREIERLIDCAVALGYHGHKNHPHRLEDGSWVKGEPYDYDLFLPGYHAAFDAKECRGKSWSMKQKDIRQAETLLHCQAAEMDAFFLILFEGKKLLRITASDVASILRSGRKTVHQEECEVWEIDGILKKLAGA